MDDARGQPAEGEGADDQLADRYAIGAQLSQNDRVQTFRATDRLLDRPVLMVVESGAGGETLAETCQALAGVLSPNLVDIYDHGGSGTHHFVVCELPMSTVASLVQKPDESLWNEGWAIDTANQLEVALAELNRTGVETDRLHFGYIGIDEGGRVRLSPWPLAEHPDSSTTPASQQELVASVLESGVRAGRPSGSPKAADLVAGQPETSAGDVPLVLDLPPRALAGFGAMVDDGPMDDVPLILDLPPAPPDGFIASVHDKPTGGAPVTAGAVLLSQNDPAPVDRWRRRVPWPLAAGVCIIGLAAFFAFSLVSANPPPPANASSNAGSTIAGIQLPITPVSVSATAAVPLSTTTTTSPAKATPTTSDVGGGAIPPVGTAPATTDAPSTTTTTLPPPTTTTTAAPSTTTTTMPPPTTTTTTTFPPPTTTTTTTP